jgi:hypothetical protein
MEHSSKPLDSPKDEILPNGGNIGAEVVRENCGKFNEEEIGKEPEGVFSIMNCRMGYAAVEREAKVENALKEGWEVVVSPRSLL